MISRRGFLASAGLTILAMPLAAKAQQSTPLRIGILWTGSPAAQSALREGIKRGLRESGFTEGHNILVEDRAADDQPERLPNLAADLVGRRVAAIVTQGTLAALAAKAVTKTIPIVMTQVGDPVGSGLVKSLAGLNGNITGVTNAAAEISAKRLQLLKEALPTLSRVTVLWDAAGSALPGDPYGRNATDNAGRSLGLTLQMQPVRGPDDFAAAFAAAVNAHAEALVILPSPVLPRYGKFLVELAAKHHLPAMYQSREFTVAGGLMSYGPNAADVYHRAGGPNTERSQARRPSN